MSVFDSRQYHSSPTHDFLSQPLDESQSPQRNIFSNLNFLKGISDKKGSMPAAMPVPTADAAPPKRRGPKPDSKPALSRRQELNRQAQRTHRERKEQYVKSLELQIMRLKDLYGDSARERDQALAEVGRLKALLSSHGLHADMPTPVTSTNNTAMQSLYGSSTGSNSDGYRRDSENTSSAMSPISSSAPGGHFSTSHSGSMSYQRTPSNVTQGGVSAAQLPASGFMAGGPPVDYDQLGVDFVLALERPCMEHIQYLVVRSQNVQGQVHHHPGERPDDNECDHLSGHALMATCPPIDHIMAQPAEPYGHKMPDISKPALVKLLEASAQLPPMDGGEVPPVQAWLMILRHEKVGLLTAQDFETIQSDLLSKVRCYGFGAVVEEFEIRDALSNVLAAKGEFY